MELNLSVWDYYPRDGGTFVDPLYIPYMPVSETIVGADGEVSKSCPVRGGNWKQQGYPTGMVNPALVRKGWGMDFQLLHPGDPCPEGWTKGEDGWCVENEPEFGDHGLYSKYAFVPKYQYWESYAPRAKDPAFRELTPFDMKSVNPWTGDYNVSFISKPASIRAVYGRLPVGNSYIA